MVIIIYVIIETCWTHQPTTLREITHTWDRDSHLTLIEVLYFPYIGYFYMYVCIYLLQDASTVVYSQMIFLKDL